MTETSHILVFRFSALGDVAMTVPVMRLLLQQHPHLQITFVSDPFMEPMFAGINRLHFIGANTRTTYKGLAGLSRLSREISKLQKFDAVADLHNVLRTKIIRLFLRPKKQAVIDKGRDEKKELTRPVNKKLRQLKTAFERYADVFGLLGFPVSLDEGLATPKPEPLSRLIPGRSDVTSSTRPIHGNPDRKILIGVAPFARHLPKMYPLEKMKAVVQTLTDRADVKIILFGSSQEASVLKGWESANVHSVAGTMSFEEELNLISQLGVMISMDSANMHLASMYGVPVVSVWGGTHPYLGFNGWGQPMDNVIQADWPCRPSSVFGNKPCPVHGEQGCMTGIEPSMIVDRVSELLRGG